MSEYKKPGTAASHRDNMPELVLPGPFLAMSIENKTSKRDLNEFTASNSSPTHSPLRKVAKLAEGEGSQSDEEEDSQVNEPRAHSTPPLIIPHIGTTPLVNRATLTFGEPEVNLEMESTSSEAPSEFGTSNASGSEDAIMEDTSNFLDTAPLADPAYLHPAFVPLKIYDSIHPTEMKAVTVNNPVVDKDVNN